MVLDKSTSRGGTANEIGEKMLSKRNMELAIKKVKSNKGAPGVDNMMVEEIDKYFEIHGEEIITAIMNMKYKPKPVRRVYIPKADGKQRPLATG